MENKSNYGLRCSLVPTTLPSHSMSTAGIRLLRAHYDKRGEELLKDLMGKLLELPETLRVKAESGDAAAALATAPAVEPLEEAPGGGAGAKDGPAAEPAAGAGDDDEKAEKKRPAAGGAKEALPASDGAAEEVAQHEEGQKEAAGAHEIIKDLAAAGGVGEHGVDVDALVAAGKGGDCEGTRGAAEVAAAGGEAPLVQEKEAEQREDFANDPVAPARCA